MPSLKETVGHFTKYANLLSCPELDKKIDALVEWLNPRENHNLSFLHFDFCINKQTSCNVLISEL